MNTVASTEKTNSLEQDNTVNQKQTTATEFEQKQHSTSFVSPICVQAER